MTLLALALMGTVVWLMFGVNAAGKELDYHYRFGTSEFNPSGPAMQRSTLTKYTIYALITLLGLVSWLVISASDGAPRPTGAQFGGWWTNHLPIGLRASGDVEVSDFLVREHESRKIYAQRRLWAKQKLCGFAFWKYETRVAPKSQILEPASVYSPPSFSSNMDQ